MACRRNISLEVRPPTWNVSTIVRRSGEGAETLYRRKIDLCCAQETKWNDGSAKINGDWGLGTDVGVPNAERLIDCTVDVVMVNELIM